MMGQWRVQVLAVVLSLCPLAGADIVGDPDRLTQDQFARKHGLGVSEVAGMFSATAVLKCPNSTGSANVVLNGRIAVTASHILMEPAPGPCESEDARKCRLEFRQGDVVQSVRVTRLRAMGWTCARRKQWNDWAVLELENAPQNVIPYDIPDAVPAVARTGDGVITVGASSAHHKHPVDGGRELVSPKLIGDCQIRDTVMYPDTPVQAALVSDCDSSPGSSGGAVLVRELRGRPPLLLAIIIGGPLDNVAWGRKLPGTEMREGAYNRKLWMSVLLPLNHEFHAAVRSAFTELASAPSSRLR